jgi:serine/threonine protein phosphatase 1
MRHLAWWLRNQLTVLALAGGREKEIGLRAPIVQIAEAVSGFARGTGKVIAEVSGGILSLFPQRVRYGVTKPVALLKGPPAQIPSGRRVYAVGDIHGRADLLIRLMQDLREDTARGEYEGKPILIFLGDYVDRGPRWAEYGGAETLVSYGVQPPRTRTSMEEWMEASEALNGALPPEHLHFLSNLDLSVRIGDYLFVHAGVRPGVPLDQQTEQDLLWIREEFLGDKRSLGAVIVHGHTPEQKPHHDARRVGLDTGAYLSGRLTAARFEHDRVEFIATEPRVAAAPAARA